MVDVLVILDGASEPWRDRAPTSLELASTPALDRLAREGDLTRLRTIAPGLPPGSEAAIPALLGWTPRAPVDRGALEAAAYGIEVGEGERAWRIDVLARGGDALVAGGEAPGARCFELAAEGLAAAVAGLRAGAPRHTVHILRGHRLLLVGPSPLPPAARGRGLRVWPEGVVPPAILGPDTVLVGARGAAIGAARIMGAATIVPAGATGLPRTDLVAKAQAAIEAIAAGAARVVVHVGGPDEAAHARDRAAKVAAIERADRDLVGPLAEAVGRAGGTLTVCPDHGCDPASGEHDAAAVPCVAWSPADASLRRELERIFAQPSRRLTERAVAGLPEAYLAERVLGPGATAAGAAP